MAVTSATSSISYTGNNSTTTSYAVPFVFLENSHLSATAKVTATGVESAVTLVDHIGAGNPSGGNVRTAVAVPATSTLTIFRTVPATQTTTYQEGGDFPAASHERALDKLTMLSQQAQRGADRAIKVTEADGARTDMVAAANSVVTLDSNKQPTALTINDFKQFLNLDGTVGTPNGIKTFADAAARALAVPDFTGQLGTQRDSADIYISTGTAAGDWSLVDENMSLADFAAGFFTADATGRGKFQDGFVTSAKLAYDGGPMSGFRNRIINGGMRIDQRNSGASVTPTTSNEYTLDRWAAVISTGSKFSVQRSAVVPAGEGFVNSMHVTSLSAHSMASSDYFYIVSKIEGFNVSDLMWGTAGAKPITLSFWARSSLTGTFVVAARSGVADAGYPATYTINAANTWEKKTITIIGPTAGTFATDNGDCFGIWFSLGAGSVFNGTANTWGSGSGSINVSGATNIVATNGATFYITGVQVEQGTVATPFEARPIGTELALCQRYFQLFGAGTSGQEETTTTFSIAGALRQTMRVAPTVTYVGSTYSQRIGELDRTITGVSINSAETTNEAAWILLNCSGGNAPSRFFQNRNALSPIQLSAEL